MKSLLLVLENVNLSKGFPSMLVKWILKTVRNVKVVFMVNDSIGPYFETEKGLRQEDPMSPILFNYAVDTLSLMVKKACESGIFRG